MHAAFHRPLDPFGLIPPLTALTERYEDEPERRSETAEEIRAVLLDFRAAAPWPR